MLKISGCGDILIANRLPYNGYEGFKEMKEFLKQHDVCFGNLETTIHNNEGYPSLFPGGGYAMAEPAVLEDIKEYGFNLLNIANNHTMDYSHKGLEATLGYLKENGIAFAGAGMNLAEANMPCYVETSNGRVALISATSSFHDSDAAGQQGINMNGRPGVNPLRHNELYQITPDLMEAVERIVVNTGINEYRNLGAKNGYVIQSSNLKLRDVVFTEGDSIKKISTPSEIDTKRICRSIKEAKSQADCVIISLHGHQLKGKDEVPDDFIVDFCHKCVEAGANIVFCHGAHVVRGIEKYGKGIIFYGLGDFIMKNEVQTALPADFYEKYNIPYEDYGYVGNAMDVRSNNQTRGMCANPKVWQSIIPSINFSVEEQKIESVRLYPITLHYELPRYRRGWPSLIDNKTIIMELAHLSAPYGTDVIYADGYGEVKMNV